MLVPLVLVQPCAWTAEAPAALHFRQTIQPLLAQYCYDCHGDGMKKGGLALDTFEADPVRPENRDLWWKVMKYVRAGIMPPKNKTHPSSAECNRLATWIKFEALGIDPTNLDPGRITIRRLNRVEYHNTIRDLMGVDFPTEVEFPPDDTGYGFDDIGDVLTLSPMLLEKYVAAAKAIVAEAVPTVSKVIPETIISGNKFHSTEAGGLQPGRILESTLALSYYQPAVVTNEYQADHAGEYRLGFELVVKGEFDFDPGKCRVQFKVDNQEVLQKEFGWYDRKTFHFDSDRKWEAGKHQLALQLEPLTPAEKKIHPLELRLVSMTIRGPADKTFWRQPKNYARFFPREVPGTRSARRKYAQEILTTFAKSAYRRPADERTIERLSKLAEEVYSRPNKTFEAGVAQAFVAVLSSPRFLFRIEEPEPSGPATDYASVDEYALASRLSYFLWSSMPDDILLELADRAELRKNLDAQVKRMMSDSRAEAMVKNFTGQWLQLRDIDGITIDARAVFSREKPKEPSSGKDQPAALAGGNKSSPPPTNAPPVRKRFPKPPVELDHALRQAMRQETELCFSTIVREDRAVTELIDSDYTFLNEKLAKVYGISDVSGEKMRRVTLPSSSPRGGVLTDASVLVVTSNPDRTSPVKRGLFVLGNILGTPPPPPPPNVPALEASEKEFKEHPPTIREALELHRDKPLCSSCHARMDPIGLAFENFNALGIWREEERGQPIETGGKLITGESFTSVHDLKQILLERHRTDFYRCLTEKLLTYALGRGLEFYDVETVDRIVARLELQQGRFSALLTGIIDSVPFQKQRNRALVATDAGENPSAPPNRLKSKTSL
jgi:hypothetical protein